MYKKILFISLILIFICSCDSKETSQQEDKKHLISLFNELQEISLSEPCIDASEWKFIGYGAKACGGFQGYIAYSSKIDEVIFLQLIENYTQEEKNFNLKWGIISDCAVVNPPTSIDCKNNLPVLL